MVESPLKCGRGHVPPEGTDSVTWVFKRSVIAMFQVALVFALTIGLALCLALAALVVILNLVILAL